MRRTHLTSVFALAALLSTVAPALAAGTVWNIVSQGAACNGSTNDRVVVTATISTAAAGDTIYFPPGNCIVSGGDIVINKSLTIRGDGQMSSVVTQQSTTASIFTITTTAPVEIRDMVIQYSSAPSAGACINVAPAGGENARSQFSRLVLYNCHTALNTTRASQWSLLASHILFPIAYGIVVQNLNNPDSGDSQITGNQIWLNASGNGVRWLSSGGLRISNNKIISGDISFEVVVNPGVPPAGLLVITGNSIENYRYYGVSISAPSTDAFQQVVITGNQFGQGLPTAYGAVYVDGVGIAGVTITGNNFGTLYNNAIALIRGSGAMVDGNVFHPFGTGTTGIYVASTFAEAAIGENQYNGVTTPVLNASSSTRLFTSAALPLSSLGPFKNGSQAFCSNCQVGVPACTAGGAGTIAHRINGAWRCL